MRDSQRPSAAVFPVHTVERIEERDRIGTPGDGHDQARSRFNLCRANGLVECFFW
ncbi:MAG: hypothetical protein NVS4B2_11150 [Chloroflexota bacterium]